MPHINTNSREPVLEHCKPWFFLIINQASSDSTQRVKCLHTGLKSCMCTLIGARAHTQTHTSLNRTPPQLATTNQKVWRRCMVWRWEVWTPSPGHLLYTQSSGQLSQRRIHTYILMNTLTVSLCSLPSSLFITLSISFFTLRSCSHKSCLHHTCHAPAHYDRVCVQAGLNRLPKQSLFQMKKTVPHSFPAFFIPVALQNA